MVTSRASVAPRRRYDLIFEMTDKASGISDWSGWPPDPIVLDPVALVRARALERPSEIAFRLVGRAGIIAELSWQQLDARARVVAWRLRNNGASRVLVVAVHGVDFLIALLGCMGAGVAAIPVPPPLTPAAKGRFRAVLEGAAPSAILCAAPTMELPSDMSRIECVDGDVPTDFIGKFDPTRIAIIQYSSGSTSVPRGVLIDGFNLSAQQRAVRDVFGHDAASRVLTWLPGYHDMGLIGGLLQPLYTGIECVWLSTNLFLASPLAWLRAISEYRATTSGGPNFAYESCIAVAHDADLNGIDLSTWRVAFNGSEAVRGDTIERFAARFAGCGFQARAFLPCYGLAEATLMATASGVGPRVVVGHFEREALAAGQVVPASNDQGVSLVACGAPVSCIAVAVVDDSGAPLGSGRVGEIVLSGPTIARGYLGEQDSQRFGLTLPGDSRRWLQTGDLGFVYEGRLYVGGRDGDVITVRGSKHHATDIECTARDNGGEAFASVVAIGVKGAISDRVVLFVERDVEIPVDQTIVKAVVEAVGHTHGVAVTEVVLAPRRSLPRTTSGKIRRAHLRQLFETQCLPRDMVSLWALSDDGHTGFKSFESAANTLTKVVAAFREIFHGELIFPDSDFFALGGDSLRMHALCAAIEQHTGYPLGVAEVFEARTPLALTDRLTKRSGAPISRFDTSQPGELSPAQRRIWFSEQVRPGFPFYHVGLSIELDAKQAVDAQVRLHRIVAAEPSLRTVFVSMGGEPIQRVLDAFELPFCNEEIEPEDLNTRLLEEVCRPFDLAQGVARALLLLLPDGSARLLLTVHHIVCDGWGAWQLAMRLHATIRENVLNNTNVITFDAIQYLHRCATAASRARAARAAGIEYFVRALDALPEVSLPLDFDRPLRPTLRGARRHVRLSSATYARIVDAARRDGGTAFSYFLTALAALVRRFTGSGESLVGIVVSAPPGASPEPVACDLNFLPLRVAAADDTSLSAWGTLVRKRYGETLVHADTAFDDIVRALNPDRTRRSNPIYNTGLWFNDQYGAELPPAMQIVETPTSELDLRFVVAPNADGSASVNLEYANELFLEETAQQLLDTFLSIVDACVETPHRSLGEIDAALAGSQVRTFRRISIAANFTIEPALDAMQFWCRRLELPMSVALAPYDQIEQQLLQPNAAWFSEADTRLVVIDPDAWVDANGGTGRVETFLDLLDAHPQRRLAIVLCVLPAPSGDSVRAQAARRVAGRLLSSPVSEIDGPLLDLSNLAFRYCVNQERSPYIDELGRHPFTLPWLTALGTQLFRQLRADVRRRHKVLVLDCDGTLWDGECAFAISIPEHKRAFQRSVLRLRASGVILALCTRNRKRDVIDAFSHPDMCIRLDDIAAIEASWEPKSQSLRRLADALSLSTDSFVLIDDDPVMCAEVLAHCSDVCVVHLPESQQLQARVAEHLWELDGGITTEEDGRRAEAYRDEAMRRRARSETTDLDAFVAGLRVEVRKRCADPGDAQRIAQLAQRSNQFNLSDCRLNVGEVLATLSCWRVAEVQDRFGSYGLTCAARVEVWEGALNVDALILSCRVLGRGVETTFFELLQAEAQESGLPVMSVAYRRTLRNAPAFMFLRAIAPNFNAEEGRVAIASDVCPARHSDVQVQTPPLPLVMPWETSGASGVSVPLGERVDAGTILAGIESERPVRFVRRGPYVAPSGPVETLLAEIFAEALRVDRVGASDDFFELGGYSMLALRVVWRIHDAFGVNVHLSKLYDAPTVAALADVVVDAVIEINPSGLDRVLDESEL